jgi:hypothetical protein
MKSSALTWSQTSTPSTTAWWRHPYTIGAASTTFLILTAGYFMDETYNVLAHELMGATASSLIVAPLVRMGNIGGTLMKDAICGAAAALAGGGIILAGAESMGDRFHNCYEQQEKVWQDNKAGIMQIPERSLTLSVSDYRARY